LELKKYSELGEALLGGSTTLKLEEFSHQAIECEGMYEKGRTYKGWQAKTVSEGNIIQEKFDKLPGVWRKENGNRDAGSTL